MKKSTNVLTNITLLIFLLLHLGMTLYFIWVINALSPWSQDRWSIALVLLWTSSMTVVFAWHWIARKSQKLY